MSINTSNFLTVIDCPAVEDFADTLALQQKLLNEKCENRSQPDALIPDALIMVEHHEVYTVGRGVAFQNTPKRKGVKWIEISRGGEATFHGPGQLVLYPIFDLMRHGQDVEKFLRRLEQVVIGVLSTYGIQASTRVGLTGVWVQNSAKWEKIASIGIGLRRWVSYHGIALNISTDLSFFHDISACGMSGEIMTSLKSVWTKPLHQMPNIGEVKASFIKAFQEEFNLVRAQDGAKEARPSWLKAPAPSSNNYQETRAIVKDLNLVTVCEEAHCPNIGECWSHHTATFMIMGELCTRRCSFCSVRDGSLTNLNPLDPLEPLRVAQAIAKLGLRHVVITSVNRDDLLDMGAGHFNATVKAINQHNPQCAVELLIPDMRGERDLLDQVLKSGLVKVLNHNIETVPRLYREVRPGSRFERSLQILQWAASSEFKPKTKSGLMLGLGETKEEVLEVMDRLRSVDCQILTLGQYLQPTEKQLSVQRYVNPEEFADLKLEGLARGFAHVESGPLVRSSYHAWKHSNTA